MKLNLEAALKKAGITQAELARRVGVTRGYVSGIVAGKKSPSIDLLAQLADALQVDIDELRLTDGRTGDKPDTAGLNQTEAVPLGAATKPATQIMNSGLTFEQVGASYKRSALYTCTANLPSFYLREGDILIVNVAERRLQNGDLALVSANRRDGLPLRAIIRRWQDPWLLPESLSLEAIRIDDPNTRIEIIGKIAGAMRGVQNP